MEIQFSANWQIGAWYMIGTVFVALMTNVAREAFSSPKSGLFEKVLSVVGAISVLALILMPAVVLGNAHGPFMGFMVALITAVPSIAVGLILAHTRRRLTRL